MILLIAGLTLWAGVHLIPALAIPIREQLISKLGEMGYKGIFAILLITAIVAMVFGWRSIDPVAIYVLPAWSRYVTTLLMLATFILFSASNSTTNIKRVIRHPQLTGLVLWSVGHLLSNGDNRSLVLFGTLAAWAIVEMILINKREGEWSKPEVASIKAELITVAVGLVMFTIFLFAHPYIAGMPVLA